MFQLTFPSLHFAGASVDDEMIALAQSFHTLKLSVSKQIDAMNVTIKKLHKVVVSLYPHAAIPNPMMAKLEGALNCQEYFTIITKHGMWSYINYHLLQCLVERLVPQDSGMTKEIAMHGSNVMEFVAKTCIDDYIDSVSRKTSKTTEVDHATRPAPAMFAPFQFRLKPYFQRKSMRTILTLQGRVMKHFSLPHPTLLLDSIRKGSTIIDFQFVQVEMERVYSVADTSSGFFRDLNVESVTIGNQFQHQYDAPTPAMHEV